MLKKKKALMEQPVVEFKKNEKCCEMSGAHWLQLVKPVGEKAY